jgi:pilus assembly protein CpaB
MLVSLLLAGAATLAVRSYLARVEALAATGGPGASVVVATADLPRGTRLTPELLEVQEIPSDYAPPGALASVGQALGRPLAADVLAGEPITSSRLAPRGGPVASLVPEGLRAVPLTVAMPPGAVVPGDLVDVLATFVTGQAHTETVVEGAEVLVAGAGRSQQAAGQAATLILLVSPDAAERLAYAAAFADLAIAVAPSAGSPSSVPPWEG